LTEIMPLPVITAGTVDEKGILWKASQVGKFTESFRGAENLYATLVASVKENGDRPAAGLRKVVRSEQVGGFEKLVMATEFEFLTYADYQTQVDSFASGIVAAIPSLKPNDTVVIYAETSRPWMISAYACWRQGLTVGTIYATLGEEGAQFGIDQSKCKAVIADAKLLKILAKIAGKLKHLKDVITMSEPAADAVEKLKAAGINVHLMDELTANGAKAPVEATPAGLADIAVLMYTSGTTGNPKGVLISHKSVLSAISSTASPTSAITKGGRSYLRTDSVYLAYLPLAHIMELAVEITCFAVGCKVGYGSPGTITPASIKMLQTEPPQQGDAQLLGPTMFVAAPAVLDKVLIGVKAKFSATSPFIQGRIAAALKSGYENFDNGGVGCHWSYIIGGMLAFKKAQKLLGGKVEMMLTGSAPLGVEVQKYVQTVFNCRVRQGYGLTETCAATCLALATDNSTSCVGPPQESACIKLRDWEEGNYKNADLDTPLKDAEGKEYLVGMRRGEILIGGPTVCDGYLVDADAPDAEIVAKNKEDFVTLDGIRYFCTGDVGQFTPAGNLQIIDRKKDLVKLQMGEYVALSKVENALKASQYTALPMIYATSTMSYCIGLVCPNVPNLKKLAASLSVEGELPALCANKDVLAAVLKDVQDTCKAAKLAKFEVPTKILLIEELWTPENDMLTAVQKLKRRDIVAKHKKQIDEIYV